MLFDAGRDDRDRDDGRRHRGADHSPDDRAYCGALHRATVNAGSAPRL